MNIKSSVLPWLRVGLVTCCLKPKACIVLLKIMVFVSVRYSTSILKSPSMVVLCCSGILSVKRSIRLSINIALIV